MIIGAVTTSLALGSNIGNREEILKDAIRLLQSRVGKLLSISRFYETAPEGFFSVHPFLNAVVSVNTALSLESLLEETQTIERILGRIRKHGKGEPYSDRPIDIDILFYGSKIEDRGYRLRVPHPMMHLRRFVLEPLASIQPLTMHPVRQKTVWALLQDLLDKSSKA